MACQSSSADLSFDESAPRTDSASAVKATQSERMFFMMSPCCRPDTECHRRSAMSTPADVGIVITKPSFSTPIERGRDVTVVTSMYFLLCAGLPTPHDNRPKVSPMSQPTRRSLTMPPSKISPNPVQKPSFPPQNILPVGSFPKTNPPKKLSHL